MNKYRSVISFYGEKINSFSSFLLEFLGELTNKNQQALLLTICHCSVFQCALYPDETFHHVHLIRLQDFQERNLDETPKNES